MRSLSIAATGMLAQQLNIDVIANNLANMSTAGFKRQRAEFQDLLYQNLRRPGASNSQDGNVIPTGIQLGAGVETGSIYRITEQGNLAQTGNTYDIAVQGRGYIAVELPSGDTAYTRDGSLQLNQNGQIVTSDGYMIDGGLTIPTNALDVTINNAGLVQYTITGNAVPQTAGTITLTNFVNPAGLDAIGGNLLLMTAASGDANIGNPGDAGFGTVLQGYIESSNVNPVQEITTLISAQRAYDMNAKVITASDEMLQTNNQLG